MLKRLFLLAICFVAMAANAQETADTTIGIDVAKYQGTLGESAANLLEYFKAEDDLL